MALELEPAYSSGEQGSSGVVSSDPCYLVGVSIHTNGSADAILKIYDHASAASGTVKEHITVKGADYYGGRVHINPIIMDNGIYASISGTSASYIVEYLKP